MAKFNYQIVYKCNDDERIIFAGQTKLSAPELINVLDLRVSDDLITLPIESFIYQPEKSLENESQKVK